MRFDGLEKDRFNGDEDYSESLSDGITIRLNFFLGTEFSLELEAFRFDADFEVEADDVEGADVDVLLYGHCKYLSQRAIMLSLPAVSNIFLQFLITNFGRAWMVLK